MGSHPLYLLLSLDSALLQNQHALIAVSVDCALIHSVQVGTSLLFKTSLELLVRLAGSGLLLLERLDLLIEHDTVLLEGLFVRLLLGAYMLKFQLKFLQLLFHFGKPLLDLSDLHIVT